MIPARETPEGAEPIGRVGAEGGTTGTKTILIIRLAWADSPTTDPQSAASVMSMMAGVDSFMQENSYGETNFVTTVTDLVVLPGTQSYYISVGDGAVLSDGRAAAAAVNPAWNYLDYDLEAVRFSGGPGSYGGQAYVGARGCWLKSSSAGVAAHEFGHNLGLWHANYWDPNSDETVVGPGANQEYGDQYDTMGNAAAGAMHFNTYEKNLLGWLPGTNVKPVTTPGVYRIFAHDLGVLETTNNYALKFNRDGDREYWIEFRQHAGLAGNQWIANGVGVRWDRWAGSNNGSQLIDTTPFSPDAKNDAGIPLGQTWTDPIYGISITPIAKIAGPQPAMDVKIAFSKSAAAPTGSFDASSTSVGLGQTVNFTATGADADGNELSYHWDFGDRTFGTNSTNAVKSWTTAGQYRVRLTISDGTGNTYSESKLITVGTPLSNRYRVQGRIQDRNGNPVEGILVNNGLSTSSGNYRFGYTDSDGTYTLTNVVSGTYTIGALRGGYTHTPIFSNPLSVTTHRTNIDFGNKFVPYKITGRVVDIGGFGVAGALVSNGLITEPTDLNGNYTLPNTPLGAYPLTATKPGYILYRAPTQPAVVNFADATFSNINEKGFQITGQVTGVPSGQLVDVSTGSNTLQWLTTGNPINFTLNVPEGISYLRAASNDATYSSSFTNPINVSSNLSGLNLAYGPETTFAVSGRVTDLGNGVGGAAISLSPGGPTVLTDIRGFYYIDGISAGEYTLGVAKDGLSFVESLRQVTISDAPVSGQNFVSTTVNAAPTFATAAFANPNPTNQFVVPIGALGSDDQGEHTLRYDWSLISAPAGGNATFELDNFNSAKNTFVTFNNIAGNYTLRVTIQDLYGLTATSNVVVTVDRTAPIIAGSPSFAFETAQTVAIPFSENVGPSLSGDDFTVQNLTTGQFIDAANMAVSFNTTGNIATLGFAGNALPDGNYRAILNPAGVSDLAGNPLAVGTQINFFILAGDADRDRTVGIGDFALLAANFNSAGTFSQGNFNYDSLVDIGDFAILAAKFNQSLPAARPVSPFSGSSLFSRETLFDLESERDLPLV